MSQLIFQDNYILNTSSWIVIYEHEFFFLILASDKELKYSQIYGTLTSFDPPPKSATSKLKTLVQKVLREVRRFDS